MIQIQFMHDEADTVYLTRPGRATVVVSHNGNDYSVSRRNAQVWDEMSPEAWAELATYANHTAAVEAAKKLV